MLKYQIRWVSLLFNTWTKCMVIILETNFVILHILLSSNVIWASTFCELQQWFKISICFDAVNRTYWIGEDVRIETLPPVIFLIPNLTWLVKSNIRLSWDGWHLHLLGIMIRPGYNVLVKRRKFLDILIKLLLEIVIKVR